MLPFSVTSRKTLSYSGLLRFSQIPNRKILIVELTTLNVTVATCKSRNSPDKSPLNHVVTTRSGFRKIHRHVIDEKMPIRSKYVNKNINDYEYNLKFKQLFIY